MNFGTADRDYDDYLEEDEPSNDNRTYHIVTMESLHEVFQNAMDIAKLHTEQSIDPNKTYYEQALRIFKCLRDATFDYITKDEKLTMDQLSASFQKVNSVDNIVGVLSRDDVGTKASINV
jgi:predicted SAM-dependent methyltransferase